MTCVNGVVLGVAACVLTVHHVLHDTFALPGLRGGGALAMHGRPMYVAAAGCMMFGASMLSAGLTRLFRLDLPRGIDAALAVMFFASPAVILLSLLIRLFD